MADQTHSDRTGFFVGVFVILVILTLASFWVANSSWFVQSSRWWLMVGISAAKASLVVLFFMHFWWEQRWKYVLTIPTSIMAVILVVALVPDILQRYQHYSDVRLNHSAAPGAYIDKPIGVVEPGSQAPQPRSGPEHEEPDLGSEE